jgi:thiol-disulfide isomerase/thioredoxin
MKRLFAFLSSMLLILGCDEPLPEVQPLITLDSDQARSVTVSAEGDVFYVSFISALAWTSEIVFSEGAGDWARHDRPAGEGGYEIAKVMVSVAKNDSGKERSAKLVIKSDALTEMITFTQPATAIDPGPGPTVFNLVEGSADVGADGGKIKVTVQFNVEYDYTIPVDWIHEVETKAVEEKAHYFEVDANTSAEPRVATISFCGNGACHPYTVTQEGMEPACYLNIDKTNVSVPAEGSQSPVTVNVASNMDWTVSSDSDWCVVSPSSGRNDGSFSISVSSNTYGEPRIANVSVTSADRKISRNVSVVQAGVQTEYGDDSWKSEEFHHRSLALRFTGDWCGYCPQMATAMKNADKELGYTLEVVNVHGVGSTYQNKVSIGLIIHHGIGGYPTGLVDGRTYIQNEEIPVTTQNIVTAARETKSRYGTLTGASWTSSLSGNQVILNISAYIKKSGSYKVTAYLVEDKIIGYQADYTYGDSDNYEHNGVLRAAFTDVLGDEFTVSQDNEIKDFTYYASVPSGCVNNNLRIVVFVEKSDGSEYYVDNSATEKVGVQKHLAVKSGNWIGGNEVIIPGDDITL